MGFHQYLPFHEFHLLSAGKSHRSLYILIYTFSTHVFNTNIMSERIIMCYRYFLLLMNMKIFLNIDLALEKNDKILIVLDHMKDTIYRHVKT